jgi:hypothetical protein
MKIFYSYAHEDEELRKNLEKHLRPLRNQGVIDNWFDGDISAGTEWDAQIKEQLNTADIILLLISVDFLNSEYIWRVEVEKAMQRHQAKEARVIPIILRPCDWQDSPFSKLQALPKNAKPITKWDDSDEAFLEVVRGIKKAILELQQQTSEAANILPPQPKAPTFSPEMKTDSESVVVTFSASNIENSPLIAPEFLKYCQQELTRYIGPMASLILQDTLAENPQLSSEQLIKALANEIPNSEQARAFTRNLLSAI